MALTYTASKDDNGRPVTIVKNITDELEDWSKDTLNYVWDASGLEWVKMKQPVIETTDSNFYAILDGVETLLTQIKAIQTDKTQFVKLTDGTDTALVSTAGNVQVQLAEQATGFNVRTVYADSGLDAFSNLPVSEPVTLFDAQFTYDAQPLLYEQVTAESGASIARDATNNCMTMTFASTPTGGKAYMQSYDYHRYQPGKGQRLYISFNMNGGVADVQKFARYGDATENFQFVLDGTTPKVQLNTAGAEGSQTASQAGWNIDPLNGSGDSGLTIDFEKGQILIIDFQALYTGRVRFGFDIHGVICWVHEFTNANAITKPYIRSANLPVSCGMTSTGTVSTTMDFNCCSVQSYGGVNETVGYSFSVEGTGTAGNTARAHILSVRPKTTFNSEANRTKFEIQDIDILVTGNSPVYWELVLGQAITGTTAFNDVNGTYSGFEYNTAGTIDGSPTIVIASGYVVSGASQKGSVSQDINHRYPITLNAAGAVRSLGTLSLIATGLSAASAMRVTFNWKEVR